MSIFRRLFGNRQVTPPAPQPTSNLVELAEQSRFIAIDVETANADKQSICQIGLAFTRDDGTIFTFGTYVNPEDYFEDINTRIHGITEDMVEDAPTFPEIMDVLRNLLESRPLVQHSNFDKQAFNAACAAYQIQPLDTNWLDSVTMARRAWPELRGNGGHGLANLKNFLNLEFKHHDAEEDARAAAEVVLAAEQHTGKSFSELATPRKANYRNFTKNISKEGNADGPLFGHVACFTGQITMSREHAATIAAEAGIAVKAGVSKKVTLLVVGEQDLDTLAGHTKSSKHRRAEELIEQGVAIRIIGENEFLALVETKT